MWKESSPTVKSLPDTPVNYVMGRLLILSVLILTNMRKKKKNFTPKLQNENRYKCKKKKISHVQFPQFKSLSVLYILKLMIAIRKPHFFVCFDLVNPTSSPQD